MVVVFHLLLSVWGYTKKNQSPLSQEEIQKQQEMPEYLEKNAIFFFVFVQPPHPLQHHKPKPPATTSIGGDLFSSLYRSSSPRLAPCCSFVAPQQVERDGNESDCFFLLCLCSTAPRIPMLHSVFGPT